MTYFTARSLRIAQAACAALLATLSLNFFAARQAAGEEWPHWRGNNRNGATSESSGWREGRWPLNAAKPEWTTAVGEGSASCVIAHGDLYTLGWRDGRDTLVCLDTFTGREFWRQSYDCPKYGRHATGDQGVYSGPSSTPEFDEATGLLYTLSIDGDLQCWNTECVASMDCRAWAINLYDEYDVPQRPQVTKRNGSLRDYGYTTSPLVYGETLIVEVGDDDEGNLMGFNKRSGERLWTSESRQPAGHSGGLAPLTVEGVPCVAVLTARTLLVVRLDEGREGETVAEYEWTTDFINNIATPAVHENFVVITSAYNKYAMCLLKITLRGAEKVWETDLPSGVCSPVIHKNCVYWAWQQVHCLDLGSGELKWKGSSLGAAGSCLVTGDDRLIVWANSGDLSLVETAVHSPRAYRELARHNRLLRDDVWPHVVLAERHLYGKDRQGNLACWRLP